MFSGGARACRITSKRIYRALGVENFRHRRAGTADVTMRRLLSLDYILEHPELAWLPTEPEKVRCFETLGLDLRMLPRRIYRGAAGRRKRYFALQLPIAVDSETATFVYVDPGNETYDGLRSGGATHGRLGGALREKGIRVRVVAIAREHETVIRAEGLLRAWASATPQEAEWGDGSEGGNQATGAGHWKSGSSRSGEVWRTECGFVLLRRTARTPEAKIGDGVKIDAYDTNRAICFTGLKNGNGIGPNNGTEDS